MDKWREPREGELNIWWSGPDIWAVCECGEEWLSLCADEEPGVCDGCGKQVRGHTVWEVLDKDAE